MRMSMPAVSSIAALSLAALSACAPSMPDDAAGAGFGSYSDYMNRQTAAANAAGAGQGGAASGGQPLDAVGLGNQGPVNAQGQVIGQMQPQGSAAAVPDAAGNLPADQIGAAALRSLGQGGTGAATGATTTVPPVTAPVQGGVSPGASLGAGSAVAAAAAGPAISNSGISDENDFKAVASRQSIASDRERIEQNAASYQQIQPGALPERTGSGPNIVQYAISAKNGVGEQVWGRSSIHLTSWERNCGRFASQDLAQIEFLRRGGPQQDPGNLDPDGDGYACRWDPTPFQNR